MERSTDIVIIGGGLASLAAAIELEKSGQEVVLIRKAPGAVALSSGAWDLCDSPLRYPGEELDRLASVGENMRELLRRYPHHPFQTFVKNSSPENLFAQLQEQANRLAKEIPLEIDGDGSNTMAVVTEMGTYKPTAYVQASMAAADLRRMDRSKVLVVGIEGLAQFKSNFVAQCLREIQKRQENLYWLLVGDLEVPFPEVKSLGSLSPVEIAQALDREENFVTFGHRIVEYIQNKVYTHLLLPPVLGMIHTAQIVAALRKITGLWVGETLATPTSVPGWRLSEAILRYFKNKEFDILAAEVVGFDGEGRQIKSLRVHHGEERIRLHAKRVLLGSGKFIGGGIQRSQRFREPIFGLPVFVEGRVVQEVPLERLVRPKPWEPQPFLSAGLKVNEYTQPVDEDGNVFFENLFACGRVLSGVDSAHDRSGAGVSILTGTLAARRALEL